MSNILEALLKATMEHKCLCGFPARAHLMMSHKYGCRVWKQALADHRGEIVAYIQASRLPETTRRNLGLGRLWIRREQKAPGLGPAASAQLARTREETVLEQFIEAKKKGECICGFRGDKLALRRHKGDCATWQKRVMEAREEIIAFAKENGVSRSGAQLGVGHARIKKLMRGEGYRPFRGRHLQKEKLEEWVRQQVPRAALQPAPQPDGNLVRIATTLRDEALNFAAVCDQVIPGLQALAKLDEAAWQIASLDERLKSVIAARDELQKKLIGKNLASPGEH